MNPYHSSTIAVAIAHFRTDPTVLALLLSGSIAHGFETRDSDVDLFVLITEEAYAARVESRQLTFVSTELATYPGGFIDAKYLSLDFMRQVAERGSEAARYAFDGVKVMFSREGFDVGELEGVIREVVKYPVEGKAERVRRFRTQLEEWRCFCGEGRKKENEYLLGLAVRKLVLFGGRLVLAHNEMLYPFHKWFLKVLESAPEKPEGLMDCINRVLANPSGRNVEAFYVMVKDFQDWGEDPTGLGPQFMLGNGLTWMTDNTPVDDL
jgi:predicted nucleotidyltransferase